jgi:preprotein translocase subunit SecG
VFVVVVVIIIIIIIIVVVVVVVNNNTGDRCGGGVGIFRRIPTGTVTALSL